MRCRGEVNGGENGTGNGYNGVALRRLSEGRSEGRSA